MAKPKFNAPVELQPAFVWHCHDCGRENFDRPEICEMTDEECEEAAMESGFSFDEGCFTFLPTRVFCGGKDGCGAEFVADLSYWGVGENNDECQE